MSNPYALEALLEMLREPCGEVGCGHCGLERAAADAIEQLRATEAELRQEIEGFQQMFDLQWSRTQEADALYVAAHPRPDYPHGYKPDPGKLVGWLLEFYQLVKSQPCECADEYGKPFPRPCERCRLLGRKQDESPHPMLCVQHGGSPACEAENRRNGFICPRCFDEATTRAADAKRADDPPIRYGRATNFDTRQGMGLCGCIRCVRERDERVDGMPRELCQMIVCPQCGNKRCPHANDHRNPCTGSNEPGQPGSA